jgi:4-hydroxy-tetrahydrodipicolinate reductase
MKIALLGYGRMGKAIEQIAIDRGHEIVLRIQSNNRDVLDTFDSSMIDVAIDFSLPETAYENLKWCMKKQIPTICGTTGWLDKKAEIENLCTENNSAFLYASNFSLGVNLFFELNNKLAQLMKKHSEYEPNIHEIHHTKKLDAPSGTAITLAEGIIEEYTSKENWVCDQDAASNEVGISSERIDPVPGTHSIQYTSDIDSIEIKHTAHNRKGFALGAVLAAEWIEKRRGLFTMKDVLFS